MPKRASSIFVKEIDSGALFRYFGAMDADDTFHIRAVRLPLALDSALENMLQRDRRKFGEWVRILIEREARRRKVYPADQITI